MTAEAAAELVRRYFEAVRTDHAQTARLYAPEATLHYVGRHRLGGTYYGPEEIQELFRRSREAFGGTQRLDLHDVVAGDDHVVALLNGSAERADELRRWQRVVVFHVSDGLIAEQWIHDSDQHIVEEILGP
jgi:ketosteroid isomerase-like protein